jgi:hypothetical protein
MRIPTPLLLSVELWKNSYLGWKKLLNSVLLVFNLKSERKIIVLCRDRIAAIFLTCLGHCVDTFSELQFCELKLR